MTTTNGTAGAGTTRDDTFNGKDGAHFKRWTDGTVWVCDCVQVTQRDFAAAAAWLAAPVAVAAESGAQDFDAQAEAAKIVQLTCGSENRTVVNLVYDGGGSTGPVVESAGHWRKESAERLRSTVADALRAAYARGVAAGRDEGKADIVQKGGMFPGDPGAKYEQRGALSPTPAAAPGLATPESVANECRLEIEVGCTGSMRPPDDVLCERIIAATIRKDRARRAQPPAAATASSSVKCVACSWDGNKLYKMCPECAAAAGGEAQSKPKQTEPSFALPAPAAVPVSVAERADVIDLIMCEVATGRLSREIGRTRIMAQLHAVAFDARLEEREKFWKMITDLYHGGPVQTTHGGPPMSTAWNAQVAAEARLAQVGTDAGAARWYLGLAMERIAELGQTIQVASDLANLCRMSHDKDVVTAALQTIGGMYEKSGIAASPTRGEGEAE